MRDRKYLVLPTGTALDVNSIVSATTEVSSKGVTSIRVRQETYSDNIAWIIDDYRDIKCLEDYFKLKGDSNG